MAERDKTKIKIVDLLKSYPSGLTITDIIKKLKLSRHTVLARLHALVGEDKVGIRKINMAKLHFWKTGAEKEELTKEDIAKFAPLEEKHIKRGGPRKPREKLDLKKVKEEIEEKIKRGKIKKHHGKMFEERAHVEPIARLKLTPKKKTKEYVDTGIKGFDDLFEKGIPQGSTLLIAGGAGSGKTIFCLQSLAHHASHGAKCLIMSFEESEERLREHMRDFRWDVDKLEKSGNLKIQRFNPFDITRNVDALLAKEKGELLIDIDPVILPVHFKPDFIVLDSLSAIASAFTGKEDSYRIYIEQLFRFFEKINATSFLITETEQIPKIFSTSGVEEFLADGVVVIYNIKRGNIRERAIEVLKMRGAEHETKIVAMGIEKEGIVVYPEQVVFGGVDEER